MANNILEISYKIVEIYLIYNPVKKHVIDKLIQKNNIQIQYKKVTNPIKNKLKKQHKMFFFLKKLSICHHLGKWNIKKQTDYKTNNSHFIFKITTCYTLKKKKIEIFALFDKWNMSDWYFIKKYKPIEDVISNYIRKRSNTIIHVFNQFKVTLSKEYTPLPKFNIFYYSINSSITQEEIKEIEHDIIFNLNQLTGYEELYLGLRDKYQVSDVNIDSNILYIIDMKILICVGSLDEKLDGEYSIYNVNDFNL